MSNRTITKIKREKEWLNRTRKIPKEPSQDVKDKNLGIPIPKQKVTPREYNQSEGNIFITNNDL